MLSFLLPLDIAHVLQLLYIPYHLNATNLHWSTERCNPSCQGIDLFLYNEKSYKFKNKSHREIKLEPLRLPATDKPYLLIPSTKKEEAIIVCTNGSQWYYRIYENCIDRKVEINRDRTLKEYFLYSNLPSLASMVTPLHFTYEGRVLFYYSDVTEYTICNNVKRKRYNNVRVLKEMTFSRDKRISYCEDGVLNEKIYKLYKMGVYLRYILVSDNDGEISLALREDCWLYDYESQL